VAVRHIREPPPPLPTDLPPNVRELIEITLVKNPGMRYRSGGPFADAVAAVRAGRRPPKPSQSPPPGRASPAAIPSAAPARVAATPGARAPASGRSRPATPARRPPARRTFSSGQRALLWAAAALGALAIIIAVLIVIGSHGANEAPTTFTQTTPATGTPTGMAPAAPQFNWTDPATAGNSGHQPSELSWVVRLTPQPGRSPARHETPE
jgi:eukaryotic-like serine/threonine-protein kinase